MSPRQPAAEDLKNLETNADKIRALATGGYDPVEIAKILDIRYQHVRNVLLRSGIAGGRRREVEAEREPVEVDAGHGDDLDGPMFRPLSHNRKGQEGRRHMDPDAIDRVLRKHAKTIGSSRGYSAHSMRATFITTALENGATLDDVQRAAGHSEPGTTKLYDRRGYNPEKSASFFATY